jgi:hypothetical protein
MKVLFCLASLLCGCSAAGIRCNAHLRPINAAAPATAAETSAPGARSTH